MPRIPTVNPERRLSIGNQPNIPMSFGTAPGKAMQRLGSSIKGLGGRLGGDAKANPEQEFQNKLNLLKTENGLREQQGKIESSFNIDRDDPATFRDNQNAATEKRLQELRNSWVPSNKKSEYQRELAIERMRGNYRVRNQQFATKQRQTKLVNKAEGAVSTELNKLNPTDPNFAENFNAVREGVDALIDSAPMPDHIKDRLRLNAVQLALKKIQQLPEAKQLPFVQRLQESLFSTNGKPNAVPPSMEGVTVDGGQEAKPTPANVPKPFTGKILDKAPSSAERRAIFRKGGVVVNLDTNWAAKSAKNPNARTSPMIVIPDNATPVQRKQAQAYMSALQSAYKEHLGADVRPKVVTRSQNGRGRAATIHTEPFAVTDTKAVEFFSDGKGKALLSQITRDTLGKIPGVHFSIPHMPRNGDNGAHGSGTNEVKLARALIAEMRKPGGASPITEQSAPSSVSMMLSKVINQALPTLTKRHQAVVRNQIKEDVESVLKTGKPTADFDPNLVTKYVTGEELTKFKTRMAFAEMAHRSLSNHHARGRDDLESGLAALEDGYLRFSESGKRDPFIARAYREAKRKVEKTLRLRTSDPAQSINDHPEIAGHLAAANDPRVDPERKKVHLNAVVQARLKVQQSLGIPPVPITKAEANDLLAPLAYAPQNQKLEVAKQIALKVKEIYGEHSNRILEAATKLSSLESSDDRDQLATGQYYANRPSARKKDQQQNIEAVEKVTGGGLWESITAPLEKIYDYALGNPVVPLDGSEGKSAVPSEEAEVKGRMLAGRKQQERLPPVVIDGRTKPQNQFDQFD